MTRYIFITGGVVSSLGKGLASAALGALLQARGYKVRLRKLDPYLNVDPGTMSPYQHGEVYVTDDGAETDLDLGHYERFTCVSARQADNITSGRIYRDKLELQSEDGARRRYRIYGDDPSYVEEDGTDFEAIAEHYVSVTVVHFDLTSRTRVTALQSFDLESLLPDDALETPPAEATLLD